MCSALTVRELTSTIRSSALISTMAPSGASALLSAVTSPSSGITLPPRVMSGDARVTREVGRQVARGACRGGGRVRRPDAQHDPVGAQRQGEVLDRPSAAIFWSIARPSSGTIAVLALPVTAPSELRGDAELRGGVARARLAVDALRPVGARAVGGVDVAVGHDRLDAVLIGDRRVGGAAAALPHRQRREGLRGGHHGQCQRGRGDHERDQPTATRELH